MNDMVELEELYEKLLDAKHGYFKTARQLEYNGYRMECMALNPKERERLLAERIGELLTK
jgi:hypothetical protein